MVTGDGSEPDVYREIQAAFDGADRVAAAAGRLAEAEGGAFDDLYREAAARAGRLAVDRDDDGDTDADDGEGDGVGVGGGS
jgi:prephenate dehydrogenase